MGLTTSLLHPKRQVACLTPSLQLLSLLQSSNSECLSVHSPNPHTLSIHSVMELVLHAWHWGISNAGTDMQVPTIMAGKTKASGDVQERTSKGGGEGQGRGRVVKEGF